MNIRSRRLGERLSLLGSVCGVNVNHPHQVVLGPNAVVTDGVNMLGDCVIDLCNVKIGPAPFDCFKDFECRFGFCNDVGRRRHRWSVLMATMGSFGRHLY